MMETKDTDRGDDSQTDLKWIAGFIKHLKRKKYFGELKLIFRDGKIVKHYKD